MLQALYVYHCESIYHMKAFMTIKTLSLLYTVYVYEICANHYCTLYSNVATAQSHRPRKTETTVIFQLISSPFQSNSASIPVSIPIAYKEI